MFVTNENLNKVKLNDILKNLNNDYTDKKKQHFKTNKKSNKPFYNFLKYNSSFFIAKGVGNLKYNVILVSK